MSHKRVHSLGFENGRNELGGVIEGAIPHGPSLVEVTLRFDPEEMGKKETKEGEPIIPIIKVVMTKSKWESLKPNLEKEDGETLALAVILPTNVGLEVLPDEPDVTNEKKPDVKNKKKRNVTNKKKR